MKACDARDYSTLIQIHTHPKESAMSTITLHVEGMSCGGCVKSVERILSKQPGVTHVGGVAIGEATFTHDASTQALDEIIAALNKAKFPASTP